MTTLLIGIIIGMAVMFIVLALFEHDRSEQYKRMEQYCTKTRLEINRLKRELFSAHQTIHQLDNYER